MLSIPLFLFAGIAAVAAVTAAHLLVVRDRAPAPLPTTRFVPPASTAAAIIQRRPRDLILLTTRSAVLLLTAIGLAGPLSAPAARPPVTVVVADLAGSADPQAALDSARSLAGPGGRVVVNDDLTRVLGAGEETALAVSPRAGLTPAMIAAVREAASLGAHGHPVEMVIVSPLLADAIDSATHAVRALWPASMRIVEVARRDQPATAGEVSLRASADDPLAATLALLPAPEGGTVQVVRGELTPEDSAAAAAGSTILHWPAHTRPADFRPRDPVDTIGGVTAGSHVVIADFPRTSEVAVNERGRVAARWIDGEPAASERSVGDGCIREVAIPIPDIGDLVISREFLRFMRELSRPCGVAAPARPMLREERAMLEGSGPGIATIQHAGMTFRRSWLVIALLSAALLMLLAELGLRRRHRA